MELPDRKRGDYRFYISALILTSHAYTTAIYLLVTSFRHRSVKTVAEYVDVPMLMDQAYQPNNQIVQSHPTFNPTGTVLFHLWF